MQTHRAISVPLAGLSRAANPVIIIRRQAYKQFVQQQREVDPHLTTAAGYVTTQHAFLGM